ncbi:MAG: hypothetical protein ACC660_08435 [Acidimicrobiales bacterium]
MLVGVDWLVTIDDPATPWSIGVAISLAVWHTSMAAASVAPLATPWTRAMWQRWARRFGAVVAAIAPIWFLTRLTDRAEVGSSPALLAVALVTVAVAGLWARHGSLEIDPPA